MLDPRREELLRRISETRQNQRRLAVMVGALAAVSAGLLLWRKELGIVGFAVCLLGGLIGFGIMSSHIVQWTEQLDALTRGRAQKKPSMSM